MEERSLREQRREYRRALSRDQILDAAEQVFARHGFHDASLREIAELAEFSVGAVYSFFPGEEDIYREIFLRRAAAFMPGCGRSSARGPLPGASCSTWPPLAGRVLPPVPALRAAGAPRRGDRVAGGHADRGHADPGELRGGRSRACSR